MIYLAMNYRHVRGNRSYKLLERGRDYNAISVNGHKIYVPLQCFNEAQQENENE